MPLTSLRHSIQKEKLTDEHNFISALIADKHLNTEQRQHVIDYGRELVELCRQDEHSKSDFDLFLLEFGLSNQEGIALMCLAEALLRIPDTFTADRFIAEKIHQGNWSSHTGNSESLLVNASTWGLILTGHIVHLDPSITENPERWIKRLTATLSKPIIRAAIWQAMKIMGNQYVLGRSIKEGIARGQHENSMRFSFDMLGEAARTEEDANRYFTAYAHAIERIGEANISDNIYHSNGISVKLSALHPRYHASHQHLVMDELLPKIIDLCLFAKKHNLGLSIDAEEAARLDMSLDIFEALAKHPDLTDWNGLGFVLQAYQKRAPLIAKWLIALAKATQRRLMVRLVKGAYWDAEIKHAQEHGLTNYPVFTRKANTDVCYLHCAQILMHAQNEIYPQFATHNAYTAVAILELARNKTHETDNVFEFQRLHGMGDLLYKHLRKKFPSDTIPLRIYAPIGKHQDLLPYLVRRLLENGANSSFVNQFLDKSVPVNTLINDVYEQVTHIPYYAHTGIPTPKNIFNLNNEPRDNTKGIDLDCTLTTHKLLEKIRLIHAQTYTAGPIVDGFLHTPSPLKSNKHTIDNPTDLNKPVGSVLESTEQIIEQAIISAHRAQPAWQATSSKERTKTLYAMANLLEKNMPELIGIITLEAGRTIADSVSEIREAIDFCRYYALHAEQSFSRPIEGQNIGLRACGTFCCISPWNFPLAIFVGQIAAALAVGNTVIAKPAEQTPLIASRAITLFHKAGVPTSVLHLLTGNGATIGKQLLSDPRIHGVCFTGSTETAHIINQQIASRPGAAIPFIAETGGQNCMIVDSTALPEQVVNDIISSAFMSAGQRCSALRVVFIQEDIAENVLNMLKGAMQCLIIDDPCQLATDIGPVIDQKAHAVLQAYVDHMHRKGKFITAIPIGSHLENGTFFAPHVFEINHLSELKKEVFGPILHVIRYSAHKLDDVIAQINQTGYGLTLGIHSRIEAFAQYIFRQTHVGNTYINRNMVGAVVGVNPFGGANLSGTGPKAGGPNYLYRFCCPMAQSATSQTTIPLTSQEKSLDTPSTHITIEKAIIALDCLRKTPVAHRIEALNHIVNLLNTSNDLNLSLIKEDSLLSFYTTLTELANRKLKHPILLPGPTGEKNLLFTQGKGIILCLVSDTDTLTQLAIQLGTILTAGCPALILATESTQARILPLVNRLSIHSLPDNALQMVNQSNIDSLIDDPRICAVTIIANAQDSHSLTFSLKQRLAARKGAITPLVEFPSTLHPTDAETIYSLITYMIMEKHAQKI